MAGTPRWDRAGYLRAFIDAGVAVALSHLLRAPCLGRRTGIQPGATEPWRVACFHPWLSWHVGVLVPIISELAKRILGRCHSGGSFRFLAPTGIAGIEASGGSPQIDWRIA